MTKNRGRGKNRRKTRLIVTFVLLIACISVAAVFFLWGQNSQESKQYEAQIRQETKDFTEGLISELDQIDTTEEGLNTEDNAGVDIPPSEVPSGVITEAEKQVIAEELAELDDERKQQVLQTLSVAYSQALNEQKQEAFHMADDLISQGKADWAELVARGENTAANKGRLASEYLAKSRVMEEQMDASFHALTAKMEEQLKVEGIDPTNIIAQYQEEYKKIKSENKKALMEKVMDAVKN